MRTCPKCHRSLDTSCFRADKSRISGFYPYCMECIRKRQALYREKNAIEIKERQLKRKKETRLKVWGYLRAHPCVDCGEKDILVLQFDHQRNKEKEVSVLIEKAVKWERIFKEIEKCEIRCANCHIRRTSKQQNWYNYI